LGVDFTSLGFILLVILGAVLDWRLAEMPHSANWG